MQEVQIAGFILRPNIYETIKTILKWHKIQQIFHMPCCVGINILIVYCLKVPLKDLSLCPAFMSFDQRGISVLPALQ